MTALFFVRLKKSWKSKTVSFGLLLAVFSFLQQHLDVLQKYLSPQVYDITLMLVGIIVVVLRFMTTQPLENK